MVIQNNEEAEVMFPGVTELMTVYLQKRESLTEEERRVFMKAIEFMTTFAVVFKTEAPDGLQR